MTYEQFLAKELGKEPTVADVKSTNYVDFIGHEDDALNEKAMQILKSQNQNQIELIRKIESTLKTKHSNQRISK